MRMSAKIVSCKSCKLPTPVDDHKAGDTIECMFCKERFVINPKAPIYLLMELDIAEKTLGWPGETGRQGATRRLLNHAKGLGW